MANKPASNEFRPERPVQAEPAPAPEAVPAPPKAPLELLESYLRPMESIPAPAKR